MSSELNKSNERRKSWRREIERGRGRTGREREQRERRENGERDDDDEKSVRECRKQAVFECFR